LCIAPSNLYISEIGLRAAAESAAFGARPAGAQEPLRGSAALNHDP